MKTCNTFTPPHPLNTAVLFLVFNRLDTTKQVFEAIRTAKPPRLYIAADGARKSREDEAEKVKAVRDYVLSNIDWKCEVKTLFRDQNLGCKYAVSSAITWFFENEEMGIILEDDCLPSQSFFWFCEELLERYKNDMRIGQISGFNPLEDRLQLENDYSYSTGGSIWGWASWKRIAIGFDNFFKIEPAKILEGLVYFTDDKRESEHIVSQMILVKENQLSTWDYHWGAHLKVNSWLSVVPKKNLIKNIGFGEDATHTTLNTITSPEQHEMTFPIQKHPNYVYPNKLFSQLQARSHGNKNLRTFLSKIKILKWLYKVFR